jgi:hypothetical protein
VKIGRLALTCARRLSWVEANHADASAALGLFLTEISRDSRAGIGLVRAPAAESGEKAEVDGTWLQGEAAGAWIAEFITTGLLPAGGVELPGAQPGIRDEGLAVFFDVQRLLSCWADIDATPLSETFPGIRPDLSAYVTLGFEWLVQPQSLVIPLRITNYWPADEGRAPQPPPESAMPAATTLDSGTALIEDVYWREIETAVQGLLEACGIPYANTASGDTELFAPAFYLVELTPRPRDPQDVIAGTHREAAEVVAAKALGLQQLAATAEWATLFDSVVVLSRLNDSSNFIRQYYLMIAYGGDDQPWEAIDALTFQFARQVLLADFYVAWSVTLAAREAADYRPAFPAWESLVPDAVSLARTLQSEAEREVVSNRTTVSNIGRLELALSRLGLGLLPVDKSIRGQRARYDVAHGLVDLVAAPISTTSVTGVKTIRSESLTRLPLGESDLKRDTERIRTLHESFDAAESAVSRALAAGRRGSVEAENRSEQRITRVLVLLAGLTALPLIVGHETWDGIEASLGALPRPLDAVAPILAGIHPYAVWLTLILAISGFWLVVRALQGPEQSGLADEPLERRLATLWRLVDSVNNAPTRTREERVAADRRVAAAFCRTWVEVNRFREHFTPRANETDDITAFATSVELTLRPEMPIALPRTLTFMRFRFDQIWGRGVITDAQFQRSLMAFGFEEGTMDALLAIAQQDLPDDERLRHIESALAPAPAATPAPAST